MKKSHVFGYLVVLVLLLTGCCNHPNELNTITNPPYCFFDGIWHGICAIPSMILNIFNYDILIFKKPNTGTGYAVGCIIGICIFVNFFFD